jgi:nitroreductase
MSGQSAPERDTLRAALYVACRAPSLHNSQPWRWQLAAHSVRLRADPARMLAATDPTGRQMVISCGAALQHARVAFAALGWHTVIHRLPNPADPDHLASIEFERSSPIRARDVTLAAAAVQRRTDRRPFLPSDLPKSTASRLASAACTEGAELLILPPMVAPELLMASRLADLEHDTDAGYQAELNGWTGTTGTTEGIPAAVLLTPVAAQRVQMARDFQASGGTLTPSAQTPDGAALTVLRTADDDRRSWLRTGEALAAVLLEATAAGLATCTLTHITEIPDSRVVLERAIASLGARPGHAQVVVRIGWVSTPLPAPRTPRRPRTDVLEQLPLS